MLDWFWYLENVSPLIQKVSPVLHFLLGSEESLSDERQNIFKSTKPVQSLLLSLLDGRTVSSMENRPTGEYLVSKWKKN